jgi:hypothetical protein
VKRASSIRARRARQPPAERRAPWIVPCWIGCTAVFATLERWWFPRAWDETSLLASRFYFGDAPAFLGYASALLKGEPFDNGVPFHPPGWPVVLALCLRVLGWSPEQPVDPLAIKHVVAVISGASVGLASWLAYLLAGRAAMVVTSFLGAFHFGHVAQAAAPNSEPLYGMLVLCVLLCGYWWQTHPDRAASAVACGVLAALTMLVRAEFALCALLIPLAHVATGRWVWRCLAFYAIALFVTLAPNTFANWTAIDAFNQTRAARMPGPLPRFAPVTSYGAFNFANANHAAATGGFNFDLPGLMSSSSDPEAVAELELAEAGALDLSRPPVYRAYVDGYRMGVAWLTQHPIAAAQLIRAKLAIMLSMFDYGYLLDNEPVAVKGLRRPVDQIDLRSTWLTVVHVALVLSGTAVAVQNPRSILLAAPILTLLLSTTMFFGYVRLGVAYLPVVWILQAMAIAQLLRRLPIPGVVRQRALGIAVVAALLLMLTEAAASRERRVIQWDGLVDERGHLVEDQAVDIERVR